MYESLSLLRILPVIRVCAYTHHDAGRERPLVVGGGGGGGGGGGSRYSYIGLSLTIFAQIDELVSHENTRVACARPACYHEDKASNPSMRGEGRGRRGLISLREEVFLHKKILVFPKRTGV